VENFEGVGAEINAYPCEVYAAVTVHELGDSVERSQSIVSSMTGIALDVHQQGSQVLQQIHDVNTQDRLERHIQNSGHEESQIGDSELTLAPSKQLDPLLENPKAHPDANHVDSPIQATPRPVKPRILPADFKLDHISTEFIKHNTFDSTGHGLDPVKKAAKIATQPHQLPPRRMASHRGMPVVIETTDLSQSLILQEQPVGLHTMPLATTHAQVSSLSQGMPNQERPSNIESNFSKGATAFNTSLREERATNLKRDQCSSIEPAIFSSFNRKGHGEIFHLQSNIFVFKD
jgi:hypothetical protein